MDTQWCLTCECHLDGDQEAYCSFSCYDAAHSMPSSSKKQQFPRWHGRGEDAIRRWARDIVPGAPPRVMSRSPSPTRPRPRGDGRVSSPTHSRRASALPPPKPKLMQLATAPIMPSVSVSYDCTEVTPVADRDHSPACSPPRPILTTSTRTKEQHPSRVLESRRSSFSYATTLTSTDTLATPVTPAHPINIASSDASEGVRKTSLWKQVRKWAGPAPRVHGVDGPYAPIRSRKNPLAITDEELIAVDEPGLEHEDDGGLCGWFAQRAYEQRAAREGPLSHSVAKEAALHAQHAQHAAYAERGRKLERSAAKAMYATLR